MPLQRFAFAKQFSVDVIAGLLFHSMLCGWLPVPKSVNFRANNLLRWPRVQQLFQWINPQDIQSRSLFGGSRLNYVLAKYQTSTALLRSSGFPLHMQCHRKCNQICTECTHFISSFSGENLNLRAAQRLHRAKSKHIKLSHLSIIVFRQQTNRHDFESL